MVVAPPVVWLFLAAVFRRDWLLRSGLLGTVAGAWFPVAIFLRLLCIGLQLFFAGRIAGFAAAAVTATTVRCAVLSQFGIRLRS